MFSEVVEITSSKGITSVSALQNPSSPGKGASPRLPLVVLFPVFPLSIGSTETFPPGIPTSPPPKSPLATITSKWIVS